MKIRFHATRGVGVTLLLCLGLTACSLSGSSEDAPAFLAGMLAGTNGASGTGGSVSTADAGGSEVISAATGGTVALGDEVTLSIPGDSLPADTTITIERLSELPAGEADGFSNFGQGYRFSPPGTKFALDKPATLKIRYDAAALGARGLDPRTLQIYYFNEELGRYVGVAAAVDADAGVVTALVEHFTIYLPLAKTMVPGNNPPDAAIRDTVPGTIRAGAPIYVRGRARDYDIGGAVSSVELCYRKLQPAPGAFTCDIMRKETRAHGNLNDVGSYGHTIPSTFLSAGDLGPGDDIEYTVRVYDNFGLDTGSTKIEKTLSDVQQMMIDFKFWLAERK